MAQVPNIPLNARGGHRLFRQISGVDVYIQEATGMFAATINGREHKVGRFSEMEKLIYRTVATATEVEGMVVLSFQQAIGSSENVRPVTVASYDRRRSRYRNNRGELVGSHIVYYRDEQAVTELRWLMERVKRIEAEYIQLTRTLAEMKADPAGNILTKEQAYG